MSNSETFPLEKLDVTVTETADALTYTFVPRERYWRPGLLVIPLLLFVAFPVALLSLVGYALVRTGANRPEWELALTAVFVVQALGWLVFGFSTVWVLIRARLRPGTVLRFTRTNLWHGVNRVCELEQVRGLRLFTYPAGGEHVGQTHACLSLVIGEDSRTHGLLGGFPEQSLRAFADGLHRRLSAFRADQGLMAPLDALATVETTENEAEKLMHTRPATGSVRRVTGGVAQFVLGNRWAGIVWCVAVLAGLFATGRLIVDAGLSPAFLAGHATLGMFHFLLLAFHIQGHGQRPKKRPEAK